MAGIQITGTSSGSDPDLRFALDLKDRIPGVGMFNVLPRFWQYGNGTLNLGGKLSRLNSLFNFTNVGLPSSYNIFPLMHSVSSIREYSLTVSEFAGNPLAQVGLEDDTLIDYSQSLYVIYGGTPFEKLNSNFLNNYISPVTQKPYFTCGPSQRYTIPTQPQYLTFLSQSSGETYQANIALKFTDGSASSHVISGLTSSSDAQLIRLQAGFEQMDLASLYSDPKVLWYYDINISNGGSWRTENIRFIMDYNPYSNLSQVIWRNSRGGDDTYYFPGNDKLIGDYSQKSTENYVPLNYAIQAGSRSIIQKTEQTSIKTGCMLRSIAEAHWMRDMLLSQYLCVKTDIGYLPIEIVSSKVPVYDKEKNGWPFEFEYRFLFNNHSFAP